MLRFLIISILTLSAYCMIAQPLFEIAGSPFDRQRIRSGNGYLDITDNAINAYFDVNTKRKLGLNSFGGDVQLTNSINGFVGIGQQTPKAKLHIYKSLGEMQRIEFDFQKHGYLSFYENTSRRAWLGFPNNGSDDLYFSNEHSGSIVLNNDPVYMELTQDGRLFASDLRFIGDKKNMQYDATTGEIGYDNSSRRYKTNILTLMDDWTKIMKTRPVKYTRSNSPESWEFGYIAEEIDSIGLTNLVGYDQHGMPDDVRYDRMVIYLTELLKLQNARIESLEQEIELLKSQN